MGMADGEQDGNIVRIYDHIWADHAQVQDWARGGHAWIVTVYLGNGYLRPTAPRHWINGLVTDWIGIGPLFLGPLSEVGRLATPYGMAAALTT